MQMQLSDKSGKYAKVELLDRRLLTVCGVKNVVSFHEASVDLELSETNLVVDGENLNITKLDLESGEVCIEGFVTGMNYSDGVNARNNGSLFSRLFG